MASSFSQTFRANATTGSTALLAPRRELVPRLALPLQRIERTEDGRELPRLEHSI